MRGEHFAAGDRAVHGPSWRDAALVDEPVCNAGYDTRLQLQPRELGLVGPENVDWRGFHRRAGSGSNPRVTRRWNFHDKRSWRWGMRQGRRGWNTRMLRESIPQAYTKSFVFSPARRPGILWR
jgi:hypothetical protein